MLFRLDAATMTLLSLMTLSGCMQGPSFFQPSDEETSKRTAPSSAVVKDDSGAVTYRIDNDQSEQTLATTANTGLDARLIIPAGALAIGTEITMQEGTSIVTESTASDLKLGGGLDSASPSLVVSTNNGAAATSAFTVQLALPSGAALTDDPYSLLIVVYKIVIPGEAEPRLGAFLRSQLEIKDGFVSFKTTNFGSFQAAFTKTLVTQVDEKKTTPIVTKIDEQQATPLAWTFNAVAQASRANVVTFTVTGFAAIDRCGATIDADAKEPFDATQQLGTATNFTIAPTLFTAHSLQYRLSCRDVKGREGQSDWQSVNFAATGSGPAVALSSPASPTNANPVPFTVTFSRAVTGFEAADVEATGGTVASVTGSGSAYQVNVTPTSAAVTIKIKADAAAAADGASSLVSASMTVAYDGTGPLPPSVNALAPQAVSTVSMSWTRNLSSDGVGIYRYKFDSSDLASGTTETSALSASVTLANGLHTLYVQEKDALGNWSISGSGTVVVDASAPTPSGTPALQSGTSPTSAASIILVWTAASSPSGIASYEIVGGLPSDSTPCTSLTTIAGATSGTSLVSLPMADGTYCYRIRAFNNTGFSALSSAFSLVIDRSGPTVTSITTPMSSTLKNVGDLLTVDVNLDKPVTVTGTPRLATTAANSGSPVFLTYQSSSNGNTRLTFKHTVVAGDAAPGYFDLVGYDANSGSIKDSANNFLSSIPTGSGFSLAGVQVTVDAAKPSTPILSGGAAFRGGTSWTLNWTVSTDDGPTTGTVTYLVHFGTTSNATDNTTTVTATTLNFPTLTAGTYYAYVTAVDSAGNTSPASNTVSTTLDVMPPTLSTAIITASKIGVYRVTLAWAAATDTGGSAQADLQYSVCAKQSGSITLTDANTGACSAWATNITTATAPPMEPGQTATYGVIVQDQAGNKTLYSNHSLTTTKALYLTMSNKSSGTYGLQGTELTGSSWTTPYQIAPTGAILPIKSEFALNGDNVRILAADDGSGLDMYVRSSGSYASVGNVSSDASGLFNVVVDAGSSLAYAAFNYGNTSMRYTKLQHPSYTPTLVGTITTIVPTGFAATSYGDVLYSAMEASGKLVAQRSNDTPAFTERQIASYAPACISVLYVNSKMHVFAANATTFNHYKSNDGSAWSSATNLGSAITCTGRNSSQVAADSAGNIHAVWVNGTSIKYNVWDATTMTWGSPAVVTTISSGSPEISMDVDAADDVHVAYYDPNGYKAMYTSKPKGSSSWSTPSAIGGPGATSNAHDGLAPCLRVGRNLLAVPPT